MRTFFLTFLLVLSTVAQPLIDPYRFGASAPLTGLYVWYKMDAQPYNNGDYPLPIYDSQGPRNLTLNSGTTNDFYFTNNLSAINGKAAVYFKPGGDAAQIYTNAGGPMSQTVDGITIGFVGYTSAASYPVILRDADLKLRLRHTVSGSDIISTFQGGGASSTTVTVTNTRATWQLITCQWAASDSVPSIKNNTDLVTGSAGTTGNYTINIVSLEGIPTNIFAEILIYTNKISSTDLTQLRTYLKNKYAISAADP